MKPNRSVRSVLWILAALVLAAGAPGSFAQDAAPSPGGSAPGFTKEQIDQMVAPVALYPDAILAQLFPASTLPLQIVQAARFVDQNKGLSGDSLQTAADKQPWDPSVKALVPFPTILAMMNDKLDWTQSLGEAFASQQDDVMDSIQTLRARAEAAGNLQSTKEQKVVNEGDNIIIQPADPQVIYVPQYDAQTAYVASTSPGYSRGTVLATGLLSFAAGVAVGHWWDDNDGGWDWDDHHVYTSGYYGGSGYHGGSYKSNNKINIDNVNVNRPPAWKPGTSYPGGGYNKPGTKPPSWNNKPPSWSGNRPSTLPATRPEYRGYGQQAAKGYGTPSQLPARQASNNFGSFGSYERGSQVRQDSMRGSQSRQSSTYARSYSSGGGGRGGSYGGGGRGGGNRGGGGGGGGRGGGGRGR